MNETNAKAYLLPSGNWLVVDCLGSCCELEALSSSGSAEDIADELRSLAGRIETASKVTKQQCQDAAQEALKAKQRVV